jgi:DnaJ-class molecular chaperone
MHELPDYYAILGVSRTATQEDIRRAYQQAALRCHPDRNNQSREATEEFQRLADAYYVLGDKHRRHAYDVATQTHRPFTGAAQHVNAENVFVDAFEELLRPEVERPGWFWWLVGTIAGFLLGMIIANFLGAIMVSYCCGHAVDHCA